MSNPITRALNRQLAAQGAPSEERRWREPLNDAGGFGKGGVPRPKDQLDVLSAAEINHIVHACVRVVAQTAAQVPLKVAQEVQNDSSAPEVVDHPLIDLLEQPNPEMTRFDFIESIIWFLLLGGNSFHELIYGPQGELVEIWPITETVEVTPNDRGRVGGYTVDVDGEELRFDPDEILHIKLFHARNPWYGLAPLQAYRKGLITDLKSFEYNQYLLDNNAVPGGVISVDQPLTPRQAEEMADRWEKSHKGTKNANRVAVLHSGADYKPISLSPDDISFVQQQQLSRENIRTLFGVPRILLAGDEDVTFASANVSLQVAIYTTIMPILRKIEAIINNRIAPLFREENGSQIRLQFDASSVEFLEESRDLRSQTAERMLGQGFSPNEVRAMVYGAPAVDREEYNQGYIRADLMPLGMVPQNTVGPNPQQIQRGLHQRQIEAWQQVLSDDTDPKRDDSDDDDG